MTKLYDPSERLRLALREKLAAYASARVDEILIAEPGLTASDLAARLRAEAAEAMRARSEYDALPRRYYQDG
jgi:hypothetical protein